MFVLRQVFSSLRSPTHGHRRFRIFVGIGAGAAGNFVRLGTQALDETRRRVQQEQTGHRGHKAGSLYEIRGLLRRGAEKLSDRQQARLQAALQVGDQDEEVTIAWHCAQQLRRSTTPAPPTTGTGRRCGVLDQFWTLPDPRDRPSLVLRGAVPARRVR